jgi:hypothetical protein
MTSPTPASEPVSPAQIADLLAWARCLSEAGAAADPDQRAAYQAAKTALLARLTGQHPDPSQPPTKDVL